MKIVASRTWIDRKLSNKERRKLEEYLLERSSNPTAEEILSALTVLFPTKELPKIRSVSDWKAKNWNFILLNARRADADERAKIIANNSSSAADANSRLLDGYVFRELEKLDAGEQVDENLRGWIQAANQLARRTLDDRRLASDLEKSQAELKLLKDKIEENERKEAEREAAKQKTLSALKKGGGLSEEALLKLETAIGNL